jgi:hypothetical protein
MQFAAHAERFCQMDALHDWSDTAVEVIVTRDPSPVLRFETS